MRYNKAFTFKFSYLLAVFLFGTGCVQKEIKDNMHNEDIEIKPQNTTKSLEKAISKIEASLPDINLFTVEDCKEKELDDSSIRQIQSQLLEVYDGLFNSFSYKPTGGYMDLHNKSIEEVNKNQYEGILYDIKNIKYENDVANIFIVAVFSVFENNLLRVRRILSMVNDPNLDTYLDPHAKEYKYFSRIENSKTAEGDALKFINLCKMASVLIPYINYDIFSAKGKQLVDMASFLFIPNYEKKITSDHIGGFKIANHIITKYSSKIENELLNYLLNETEEMKKVEIVKKNLAKMEKLKKGNNKNQNIPYPTWSNTEISDAFIKYSLTSNAYSKMLAITPPEMQDCKAKRDSLYTFFGKDPEDQKLFITYDALKCSFNSQLKKQLLNDAIQDPTLACPLKWYLIWKQNDFEIDEVINKNSPKINEADIKQFNNVYDISTYIFRVLDKFSIIEKQLNEMVFTLNKAVAFFENLIPKSTKINDNEIVAAKEDNAGFLLKEPDIAIEKTVPDDKNVSIVKGGKVKTKGIPDPAYNCEEEEKKDQNTETNNPFREIIELLNKSLVEEGVLENIEKRANDLGLKTKSIIEIFKESNFTWEDFKSIWLSMQYWPYIAKVEAGKGSHNKLIIYDASTGKERVLGVIPILHGKDRYAPWALYEMRKAILSALWLEDCVKEQNEHYARMNKVSNK